MLLKLVFSFFDSLVNEIKIMFFTVLGSSIIHSTNILTSLGINTHQLSRSIQAPQQSLVNIGHSYAASSPWYVVPAPKMMLLAGPRTYPIQSTHAQLYPYYSHKDTATKAVMYSVVLSEIFRRF